MFLHYHCDRCGFHRDLMYLPRVYSLGNGRSVPMYQRHVWCSTCCDISPAESLEPDASAREYVAKRRRELVHLRDRSPEEVAKLPPYERRTAQWAPKALSDWNIADRDLAEWHARRTAPAKCLRCGTRVVDLPANERQELTHGGCGGTIQAPADISSSNGPATYAHVYDIDGNLLEIGRKPRLIPGQFKPEYEPMELFYVATQSEPDNET